MKNIFIKLGYVIVSLVVVLALAQFIVKLNSNGTGKYVPLMDKYILNTSNGNVYKLEQIEGTETFKWEKFVSFEK